MPKKKVLILCYDFPPINSAAALRPYSWFLEFHKHGIHPVIITRHWPEGVKSNAEKFKPLLKDRTVSESDEGTLIRIPYDPGIKARLIDKYGFDKFSLLRKALTLRDLLLGPFVHFFDEYRFLYREADHYLKNNEVALIMASGGPFGLFKEAHQLSSKHRIPWMPDYRDPYSSNRILKGNSFSAMEERFKRYLELKWTSNAIHFTTVTPSWVKLIEGTIHKPGSLIRNGFDSSITSVLTPEHSTDFTVTCIGTIYDNDYVDILIEGMKAVLTSRDENMKKVVFQFVGIELNRTEGTEKILKLSQSFPDEVKVMKSRSNREVLQLVCNSTAALNLNFGSKLRGNVHVKIYEYLALEKVILTVDSDREPDSIEFSKQMILVSSAKEFHDAIASLLKQWKGENLVNEGSANVVREFSREFQAKLHCELINKLI